METEERNRLLAVARSWIGTPYRHAARVKGVGADCLTLLAEVFHEAGMVPPVKIPHYPPDWHLHRNAERYMDGLLGYTREVETPLPGDIVLWKFGRCFSHGAIVVGWPMVIHAYVGRHCMMENVGNAPWLSQIGENTANHGKPRPRRFYSIWGR